MDCTWDNGNFGCEGGESALAFTSLIKSGVGIAYESDYPYIGLSGMCMKDESLYKSAGRVAKCFAIERSRAALKEALFTFGPVSVGLTVTEKMLMYTGGVFDDPECTGAYDDLGHEVLLTGWKTIGGREVWELKNSWSEYWGDQGYIYVQSENQENNCGVTTDATAVTVNKAR
jgi:C1A family cysteine protease